MSKPCHGNYMFETCKDRNACEDETCREDTNIAHGACNCKFKKYCHIPRQHCQVTCRKHGLSQNVEDCDFYKMIVERWGEDA